MKSIRTTAVKFAGLLTLVTTALPFAFAPTASAAGAASINSVSFKAALESTYDHTIGGGAWNDGSTTYQKGELLGRNFQCGDYASFFTELTTPASPAAGANFRVKIVQSFTLDTTGQSGVALQPQTGADHLLVQDGTNDSAPSPAVPTASIDRSVDVPAIVNTGTIFTSGASESLTYYVNNVKPNQTVIVRSDAKIMCDPLGSTPTGNLQSALTSVDVLSANPIESISAGAQTINFRGAGDVQSSILVKQVSAGLTCATPGNTVAVAANDPVTYCYTVTNYGGSAILNVDVTDNNATPGTTADDVNITTSGLTTFTGLTDEDSDGTADDLARGATATGSYTIAAGFANGSYTNIAVLKVGGVTKSTADAVVNVGPVPDFSITKTSTSVPSKVGDVITYTITITNTGTTSLSDVSIADPKADLTTCTNSTGGGAVGQTGHTSTLTTLPANGDTWTCTATYTVVAGDVTAKQVDNTATGDTLETASKTASRTVNLALFTISKNSSSTPTRAGDVITYSIVMTNTGNISLTGANITDALADFTTCTNSSNGTPVAQTGHTTTATTIAAGDTWTCTATHTVTQSEVNAGSVANTATGDTDQTDSKNGDKTINITRSPAFTVVKTNTTATAPKKAGDTVTYSITVTNTGNTTLVSMTITDANAVLGSCNVSNGSNIAPAGTLTCAATHVVTQAEVDAGKTENTAVATATGSSPLSSNKVTIPITPNPELIVTLEQITDKKLTVGDKVNYEVVVTNTGNVTLNNVTPSVTNFVITSCTPVVPTTLAPGEIIKCKGYHIVTKADVNLGSIRARAIAAGVSALDANVKVPATAPDVEVPLALPITGTNGMLPATWGSLMLLLGVALILRRRKA